MIFEKPPLKSPRGRADSALETQSSVKKREQGRYKEWGGDDDDNKGTKSLPYTPASGRELQQPELIRSCESVLAEDSFSSVDEIWFKKKKNSLSFSRLLSAV